MIAFKSERRDYDCGVKLNHCESEYAPIIYTSI